MLALGEWVAILMMGLFTSVMTRALEHFLFGHGACCESECYVRRRRRGSPVVQEEAPPLSVRSAPI